MKIMWQLQAYFDNPANTFSIRNIMGMPHSSPVQEKYRNNCAQLSVNKSVCMSPLLVASQSICNFEQISLECTQLDADFS